MGGENGRSEHRRIRNIFVLDLPACRDAFDELRTRLATAARRLRLPERDTSHLLIAADEVFTNIAEYAYPERSGTVDIRLAADDDTAELRLSFADRGIPFDPLTAKTPDTAAAPAERQIGGLGIHVVKSLMDDVTYRRTADGQNVLTLTKRLPPAPEAHP